MTLKLLTIALGAMLSSACSTITFVQYEQPGEQKSKGKWHHLALNGMVEISQPLNIKTLCGDKTWNKVTTEYTLSNWLVGALVPSIPYVVLYTPYTNTVECFEAVKPPLKQAQLN